MTQRQWVRIPPLEVNLSLLSNRKTEMQQQTSAPPNTISIERVAGNAPSCFGSLESVLRLN